MPTDRDRELDRAVRSEWSAKIRVYGPVQGQGSKRLGRNQVTGKPLLLDASPKTRSWRQEVTREMLRVAPERPLEGAVSVRLTIYVPRPRSHYGTGRNTNTLKASAPWFPPAGVDVDKVARAILDAGTRVWWVDDARVASLEIHRVYPLAAEAEGVEVEAAGLEPTEEERERWNARRQPRSSFGRQAGVGTG